VAHKYYRQKITLIMQCIKIYLKECGMNWLNGKIKRVLEIKIKEAQDCLHIGKV
jgi:hypothetical protein